MKTADFVETSVFEEFIKRVENLSKQPVGAHAPFNNLQVCGPKGSGKTTALYELSSRLQKCQYVDLREPNTRLRENETFYLIDNAQLWDDKWYFDGLRSKKVISAFSPGAMFSRTRRSFVKLLGDGKSRHFWWRPFTWEETIQYVGSICIKSTRIGMNASYQKHG